MRFTLNCMGDNNQRVELRCRRGGKARTAAMLIMLTTLAAACGPAPTGPVPSSSASSFSPAVTQRLQQVVDIAHRAGVPGIVAAVSVPGQGSWETAMGVADTSTNQPVRANSKFSIGSVTKTFTATAVLQLVDAGKLRLSDPLARWEPKVQNSSQITVQMLLNMTSGIFDEGGPGSTLSRHIVADPAQEFTPRQIIDMAIAQGPHSAPGQIYYSDTNYVILGKIVHEVTGQPIGKVITDQILKPLNLTHTSFPDSASMPEPATVGYVIQGGQTKAAPRLQPSALGAAGAMISTVGDLKVWAKALGTGALLSPTTAQARLHFLPLTTFPPLQGSGVSAAMPAGYGQGLANLGGLLGHDGVVPGYEADMWYSPSSNATFVVLLNGEIITSAGLQQVSDAMVVSMSQIVLPANAITTVG